jgi:hypothetical protein
MIRWLNSRTLILGVITILCGCLVSPGSSESGSLAGQQGSSQQRFRVSSLKHISAAQGKKYLVQANIGTVSQLPGVNTLLITAAPQQLIKADAILQLIDAEEQFVMEAIFPASEANSLPANDKIAAEVGNISIGTFSNPPDSDVTAKAIIDIHDDAVVAVAPAEQLEKIVAAIERLQKAEMGAPVVAEPNQPIPGGQAAVVPIPESEEPNLPAGLEAEQPEPAPAGAGVGWPVAIQPYEIEPIVDGNETLDLDLPERLNIIDLLGLVGEYLHLDYMYDADKVKGEVALRIRGRIKVKDLYSLLESVMKFKGFVMTRRGNLVIIVPAGEAPDIDPTLLPERKKIEIGDVIITRIFRLKHIDTASAKNLLSGMKLGVDIKEISDTGTLIVTEYAYRMARIEELLAMIDQPGEPRQFRFRQLKYTMAGTLAPKVKTLAEQLGAVSVTISPPSAVHIPRKPGESEAAYQRRVAHERARRPTPEAVAKPGAAQPTVYLDADERTNRILMIGLEEQLAVIDELIDALDVQQQDLRKLKLYRIEHIGADEVREKLEALGIIGGARRAAPGSPAKTEK